MSKFKDLLINATNASHEHGEACGESKKSGYYDSQPQLKTKSDNAFNRVIEFVMTEFEKLEQDLKDAQRHVQEHIDDKHRILEEYEVKVQDFQHQLTELRGTKA